MTTDLDHGPLDVEQADVSTATAITETWSPAERRTEIRHEVKVAGAPDVRRRGRSYVPRTVVLRFVRDGDGPWVPTVFVYANRRIPGQIDPYMVATALSPDMLDEVPGWLDDIITRATPRDEP